jgi:subtilase family serine protease
MTRLVTFSAIAIAIAAGAPTPSVAGAAAGTGSRWTATATRAVALRDATDLGSVAPSTPLRVVIALRMRHLDALQSALRAGRVMLPTQFVADYAPTTLQVRAVASYLAHKGLKATAARNRLLLTASGTVGQASSAFHTHIERFRQRGRIVFANTTDAQVPTRLAAIVGAVVGLNDASSMTPSPRTVGSPASSCAVAGAGYPCTYNPKGFWHAYDAGTARTGAATKIAIFAEGATGGVVKDLRTEEAANGLPKVPVSIVRTGPASADTTGLDEWDLDTQYSSGMAKNVKRLYVYDAPSLSDTDLTVSFNAFAAQHSARAASASFGECEFAASLDGSLLADDNAFMEAAAQGQTVFVSAGDTGGFCPVAVGANGVPAGAPDMNYPASSRWVIAVGGTTLVTNADGSYSSEAAWTAGGGGPSAFETPPAYQEAVAPPLGSVCAAVSIACGRGVPDIAMAADPNSGANVYVDGHPIGVGGTSLSSPLALGVWARMESARGNRLGFAGRLLYAARGTTAFHDIVIGDTGPYPATPGYDYATGIGSFDVAKAITRIG